jgi:hypothetical protein
MTKTTLAASLAATLLAGQALAAQPVANDSFRIESETQFARDYADHVERMAPGVYQVTRGPLAGKTITIGEAGLAYDLAALRAQVPQSRNERKQLRTQIRLMEDATRRYQRNNAIAARHSASTKAMRFGALSCWYNPPGLGSPIFYNGSATVTASTALYLPRSDGFYNPYYARASATANATIFRPIGVPPFFSVLASVTAKERQLGQTVTRDTIGVDSVGLSTGYVYSGPTFYHDLTATGTIYGTGPCTGYVSVSDRMTPNF